MNRTHAESLLPLRPLIFSVLLSLSESDQPGYEIMNQVNEHMGRRAIVGPGSLYRVLKELRESRLIEYSPRSSSDARRQYHRLTLAGRRAVVAEAGRLQRLVREAERLKLIARIRTAR
jgi:DNA-binding PadR family transcriptional regulator